MDERFYTYLTWAIIALVVIGAISLLVTGGSWPDVDFRRGG